MNVNRGLGQKYKRKQIFNFLEKKKNNLKYVYYKRRIQNQNLKRYGHVNVNRGLGQKYKRKQIFNFLEKNKN